MRTTLINTTFWREDSLDRLHLDSKLLYLYMLTNPDKGLSNIYHYKPKVFAAYSGLSVEQIDVAATQLQDLGYIKIFQGFFVLLKGHEMPKKGRFTEKTLSAERELVPTEVLDYFNLLENDQSSSGEIPEDSSGVAPEHKDKDKDKDKSIAKANKKIVDELFDEWERVVGYTITSKVATNRTAVAKLLGRQDRDSISRMLVGVARSQEDRYAPRISNFIDLNDKWDQLIAWGKRDTSGKGVIVV